MAEPTSIELTDFALSSNNLPYTNTFKLRNRFAKWKNWRRTHPYEEILDEDANREINSDQWRVENYQENPPPTEEYESIEIEDLSPNLETIGEAETVLDIDLESSPLLEGATAGSATLGTSLSTTSTLASLGGSVLLGGGAAVLGGITAGVLRNAQEGKGYVLPNSEYIGPGNPIPIGVARSAADQVAKDHDAGYRDINSKEDHATQVKNLDEVAIKDFDKVYEEEGDIRAKIGAVGLGIKRKVEDTLGFPLYPGKVQSKFLFLYITTFLSFIPGCLVHLGLPLMKDPIGNA